MGKCRFNVEKKETNPSPQTKIDRKDKKITHTHAYRNPLRGSQTEAYEYTRNSPYLSGNWTDDAVNSCEMRFMKNRKDRKDPADTNTHTKPPLDVLIENMKYRKTEPFGEKNGSERRKC